MYTIVTYNTGMSAPSVMGLINLVGCQLVASRTQFRRNVILSSRVLHLRANFLVSLCSM